MDVLKSGAWVGSVRGHEVSHRVLADERVYQCQHARVGDEACIQVERAGRQVHVPAVEVVVPTGGFKMVEHLQVGLNVLRQGLCGPEREASDLRPEVTKKCFSQRPDPWEVQRSVQDDEAVFAELGKVARAG